ncbi:protein cornichon homolog 4-like [Ctenocephalides felis]|uniref:protein cornichon homolog 4-like n=1 Tax=Ctenocephalides felis TaxID=7515 RepID=UPI000E6E56D0|nr:protein cornichon homolog 4-like [Ctenocephalides felis]
MISEPLMFTFSLVETGAVLFLFVYFVITLSDLECDYLNAQECCSKLNAWVMPKLIAHCFLSFILILNGQWWLMIFNVPLICWMVYEFIKVPKGNLGVYDPTEIHNRGQLKKHMRDCMINLGYHLILFFIYLYCMIISLLKGDPIRRHEEEEIVSEF